MNRIFASALFVTVPCFLACSSSKDAHTDATESQTEQLCGGNMSPDSPKCPDGTTCVVDPNDACHTSGATDCPGSCKKVAPPPDAGPQACGGNMSPDSPKCPDGTTCVVDPSDACHTSGATDCPGFCKKTTPPPDAGLQACGGNMSPDSPKCPEGTTCVANPNDACHTSGATDCPGFCVARSSAGK